LWKASTAIFGAIVVLCSLGAVLFGSWIGSGGAGRGGTPTPLPLDASALAAPLINVEVNPLEGNTGFEGAATTPTLEGPTEVPPPTPLIQPGLSSTPKLPPTETPTLVPTRVPPATSTPTLTLTPTPSVTLPSSPLDTPTSTSTSTSTPTPTATP